MKFAFQSFNACVGILIHIERPTDILQVRYVKQVNASVNTPWHRLKHRNHNTGRKSCEDEDEENFREFNK